MMHPELYIEQVRMASMPPSDSYLNDIPAVRWLMAAGELRFDHRVTILVGENGTGKSTLLEAIAVAYGFNPEGGTRNFRFQTEDSHSELWQHIRLGKHRRPRDGFFLRAESYYNVATYIDAADREPAFGPPIIDGFGGVSLHRQSHGESFLAAVLHRFRGKGLYLLDEPEAALSPMRQMTLLVKLHDLERDDSQILLSTHSPILMTYPGAQVLELSEDGVAPVNYRDTEHFAITRQFISDPDRMLWHLLDESEEDTWNT